MPAGRAPHLGWFGVCRAGVLRGDFLVRGDADRRTTPRLALRKWYSKRYSEVTICSIGGASKAITTKFGSPGSCWP